MRRGWMRLGTVLAASAVVVAGAAQGFAHGAVSPQVNIGGVACPLPDRCLAVGLGWGSSGIGRMLSWSWNGRSWRRLAVPDSLPRGQTSGLGPVSCWSASGCLALGYGGKNGNLNLDEIWNGRRWRRLSQRGSYFGSDLSCPAARECVAASGAAAAAAEWRAGRWRAMTVPFPRGTSFPQLTNVACASIDSCLAIGSSFLPPPDGNLVGFADRWNGRIWRLLRVPLPPNALEPVDLEGVSCPPRGPCLVVGEYPIDTPAGGTDLAFAARWDGGTRLREVRAPQPGISSGLGFVSCPAASRCVAVGGFDTASSAFAFSAVWHGTGWGTLQIPHPDILVALWGLSCATPSACLAVGQRDGPDNTVLNYTAVWNRARWRLVTGGLNPS